MTGSERGSPENCQPSWNKDLALKRAFSPAPNLMNPYWALIMLTMIPVQLVTTLTLLVFLEMLARKEVCCL